MIAVNVARTGGHQYVSLASFAFLVTAILLLILICKASLRQSALWLKIEVVVCIILTICYIVGTIDIFRICWYYLFDHFVLGPFIGSLIGTVINTKHSQTNEFFKICFCYVLFWPFRSLIFVYENDVIRCLMNVTELMSLDIESTHRFCILYAIYEQHITEIAILYVIFNKTHMNICC